MSGPGERLILICRALAQFSEEPGKTTRTFLSPPMQNCHDLLQEWMTRCGIASWIDPAGNLRGFHEGTDPERGKLVIGSHLDTVPQAGAFDGVLGVVLAIAIVEALGGRRLKYGIEIVGFSEEEGVRFGFPFIGSRAFAGTLGREELHQMDENGITVEEAIFAFGLDPSNISNAIVQEPVQGFLEFHIEQGPVLENHGFPLGIVETIVGQTRMEFQFKGQSNHAGTTPMRFRRDALAGAAEWISEVENTALGIDGLLATVGSIQASPNASNVIPGNVNLSLDVRHRSNRIRNEVTERLIVIARAIADRRGLDLTTEIKLTQETVHLDKRYQQQLEDAIVKSGYPYRRLDSGAGHDAMVLAPKIPSAMVFLRSPGGISHHPDENVLPEDIEAALEVGLLFLDTLDTA